MKIRKKSGVKIFFFGLALVWSAESWSCDEGLAAFKETVFAKVTRDCAGCHGGREAAPPFASSDPMKSYTHLSNYVNFSNPSASLLAIRAGNNHCKISLCQTASGQEMEALLKEWWQKGEKNCGSNGQFFSKSLPLPGNLPEEKAGFSTLSFDLSAIKPELRGVSFQIQMQNYVSASNLTKGAFRFRAPRFVGGSNSISVKGIKILMNGGSAPVFNAYGTVNQTYPFLKVSDAVKTATPIISGDYILYLKDDSAQPQFSVGFDEISISSKGPECLKESTYVSKMRPLFAKSKCTTCHQQSSNTLGAKILDFASGDERACQAASALVDMRHLSTSPLIKVPSNGVAGHPMLTDEQSVEFLAGLKSWLEL